MAKSNLQNHRIYKMLRFGSEHNYFELPELKDHLGVEFNAVEFNLIARPIQSVTVNTVFLLLYKYQNIETSEIVFRDTAGEKVGMKKIGRFYTLTHDALSRFIEMEELREAREAASMARWLSVTAIVLSLLVGGAQLIIGLFTL